MKKYRAYFDCSYIPSNPFRYSVGYAVVDHEGQIIEIGSRVLQLSRLGTRTANTYDKERRALLELVRLLVQMKVRSVEIFGDHDKLVAQVKKNHRRFLVEMPKSLEQLQSSKKTMSRILAGLRQIPEWRISSIPSNQNILANFLAKSALGARCASKVGLLTDFDHTTVEHITWLAG